MHTSILTFSRFPDTAALVQLLLEHGAQVNHHTRHRRVTPLMCAAIIANPSVISALLSARANINAVNSEGSTALHTAAALGNAKVVSMLLKAGSYIEFKDTDGNTALTQASIWGHATVAKTLLKTGADIEARDNEGCPALLLAAKHDHPTVMAVLLAFGANIEIRDNAGRTGLIYAASEGHAKVVSLLLAAGADTKVREHDSCTSLHHAASKGHEEVVSLLLAAGADMEATDNDGCTALLCAAYFGRARILGNLISAGANINAKDRWRRTTLIIAIACGYTHIADYILAHGKNLDVGARISKGLTAHGLAERSLPFSGSSARDIAEEKGFVELVKKLEAAERMFIPGPSPVAQRSLKEANRSPFTSSPTASIALPMSCLPSAPELSVSLYRHHTVSPATATHMLQPAAYRANSGAAFHSSWLIPYSSLQLGTELGRGSFAKVYNAKWQEIDVAVKVFNLPGGSEGTSAEFSASLLAKISAEANLLASIRHPHVVAFLGMCQESPCVVTENCARGSLFDVLRRAKTDASSAAELTWARKLNMAVDAATGMLHLHQRSPPVMHRDLKSPNLLVDSNWRVKVSDLGLSKLVEEVNAATTAGSTAGQLNPRWMAPEVVEGGHGTLESDVYAFGVVLWELLTWELPWSHVPNPVAIIVYIMRGDSLPLPAAGAGPPVHTSTFKEYIALIQLCTARLPAQRPPFADVVQKLKALLEQEGGFAALGAQQGSSDGGSAASSAVCGVSGAALNCWAGPQKRRNGAPLLL